MASSDSPNDQVQPLSNTLAGGTHHCPRCDRIFKRVEHLKRHQRTHDGQKQFACKVCSKSFARSDILHRHEQTHTTSPSQAMVAGRRACVECAKARERCTKEDICLRCFNRSLSCVYPPRRSIKALHPSSPQATLLQGKPNTNNPRHADTTTQTLHIEEPQSPQQEVSPSDIDGGMSETGPPLQEVGPALARILEISQVASPDFPTHDLLANGSGNFPEVNRWDQSVHQQIITNPAIEYPMNWLPFNETIGLDYNTILGFNINTGNSYEDVPMDLHEQTQFDSSTAHLDSYSTNSATFSGLTAHPFEPPAIQPTTTQSAATAASPAATINSSQGSSIGTRRSTQSGLYATSTDGARTACTVRIERSRHLIYGATPLKPISHMQDSGDDDSSGFDFPSFGDSILTSSETRGTERLMNCTIYDTIKEHFYRFCLDRSQLYATYHSQNFPSLDHLNLFIRLYFEHFDSILPVIHHGTDLNKSWLLALAVCSVGSQYTQIHEFDQCVRPLHEFLRRALAFEIESTSWDSCDLLLMIALLLSQVGLSYHGSSRFLLQARARHGTMIEIAKCSGFFTPRSDNGLANTSIGADVQSWETWIEAETRRRLAFSLWLLDCMSVYHFGQSHVVCVEPPDCSISNKELWVCKTAQEWTEAIQHFQSSPTFSSAIHALFIEKELKSNIGGFGTLILLHGIYQEFFKVKGYHARPLSSWIPSLNFSPQSPSNVPDHEALELRNAANISNWRNAALDCLDVLHWAANATIAKAAGVEHPNVLHLHFARVVLLAPYQSIQILAKSIINLNTNSRLRNCPITRDEATHAEEDIIRWAQRDEHKARLAILHCGCFYWHIRRYSYDAFYEPISVYLVTLTLWAYCSYTPRVKPVSGQDVAAREHHKIRAEITTATNAENSTQSSDTINDDQRCIVNAEDDDSHEPTFIRLDRPNDDEMVQLFVRKGRPSVMTAHIAGVGNICSSQGPIKILREGRKILSTVSSSWGRSREHTSILEALEMTMVGKSQSARTFP